MDITGLRTLKYHELKKQDVRVTQLTSKLLVWDNSRGNITLTTLDNSGSQPDFNSDRVFIIEVHLNQKRNEEKTFKPATSS